MATSQGSRGKTAAVLVVVTVPAVLAALFFVLRRDPPPASTPAPAATIASEKPAAAVGAVAEPAAPAPKKASREGFAPLETWPGGEPRILAREWTEDGLAHEEHCFYSPKGDELGCGIRRDNAPWEGTFVSWTRTWNGAGDPPTTPKETTSWHQGRKHGVWRSFHLDGTPLVELRFENDELVSRQVVMKNGNQILELGKRKTDLPASRRPLNPGK